MSFTIPQSIIDTRTGDVYSQFLFFSRPITIHKEPIQNIVSAPSNPLFGYEGDSQSTINEITYTPVYNTFSGLMVYPFKSKSNIFGSFDNKIMLNPNSIYIKLTQDGRDYIKTGGKIEKIEADGETWNLVEGYKAQQQNFLGLKFYYFEVKGTN